MQELKSSERAFDGTVKISQRHMGRRLLESNCRRAVCNSGAKSLRASR